jgi:endogenous inhibitor of DNA gyrase (YacG/DUF329 family)
MPSPNPAPDSRRAACPVCGKPAPAQHHPFCSQGCRDRDLLQWLGDGYRVPGPPADFGSEGGAGGEHD